MCVSRGGGVIVSEIKDEELSHDALARWISKLEHGSVLQKVTGSIPSQGTYLSFGYDPSFQASVGSNKLTFFSSITLSQINNKYYPWMRI